MSYCILLECINIIIHCCNEISDIITIHRVWTEGNNSYETRRVFIDRVDGGYSKHGL